MNSIDRRSLLRAGLVAAGTAALGACGAQDAATGTETGREHRLTLTAAPAELDLGAGITASTWTYGSGTAGREVRITAGDTLVAEFVNRLPDGVNTSVHWHGVALRNDMDGAPPVTQPMVAAGETFRYRFVAPDPGTYFFHPHVGVQVDRGMYAPLIVEDPHEPLWYDDEWVVVIDDWLDGVTGTPDEAFAELSHEMSGMSGMASPESPAGTRSPRSTKTPRASKSVKPAKGTPSPVVLKSAASRLLGGHAGDVRHPYHLVNGKVPHDPDVYTARSGSRVRLRIINAGGDTAYRVALGGHRMTVTHTDGFPVEHLTADTLLIGMGERYDVLVTLDDGVFPLVALAEGKNATGLALIRTGPGTAPTSTVRPAELDGSVITASRLRAKDEVRLDSKPPDVTHRFRLTGSMNRYNWAINGKRFDMNHVMSDPYLIERGDRVRLEFMNASGMWHPMHLHGHTYQIGAGGPRKDTSIVLPGKRLAVDFDADNPGEWLMHCHNVYHGEAGMMALLAYRD